jgi:predicted alpha/beta superfamily hydrolase
MRLPFFVGGRQIYVYTPPGYEKASERYPVLYVQDGEMMFDANAIAVDGVADSMLAMGAMRPIIIVGVASGRGAVRELEYTPFVRSYGDSSGGGGDEYLRTLREQLKPFIDSHFRTLGSRGATSIAGVWLGGLISVYAGYVDSSTFGISCSMSGFYYWDGGTFVKYVRDLSRPAGMKLFVDVGMWDDNVWDAQVLNAIATRQGFVPGVDYSYSEVADGTHDPQSWRARMPALLHFVDEMSLH